MRTGEAMARSYSAPRHPGRHPGYRPLHEVTIVRLLVPPVFLAMGLACAGVGVPSAPGSPSAGAAAAPAATIPADATLLASGVCGSEREIASVTPIVLADGRTILQVNCFMAAYQGRYYYAWAAGPSVVTTADGAPLRLTGMPSLDAATGVLTWVDKARGAGDCGDWYRYVLTGDQFALQEQRHQACGADGATFQPESWPLAGKSATAPNATAPDATAPSAPPTPPGATAGATVGAPPTVSSTPSAAPAIGHCAATEIPYFSCPTSKGKVISVCGAGAGVQYRFGPLGHPELVYPAVPSATAFTLEERQPAGARATLLSFENAGVGYEVVEAAGAGAGELGEGDDFKGVYVSKASERIAKVRCSAPPTTNWDALKGLVPPAR
ncbi:MAG: DUF1176 domain-containing protein [Pseudomonadota bacterium]|nr:DUF1176 domain-containing protein [Pseudomonadota bacterium]